MPMTLLLPEFVVSSQQKRGQVLVFFQKTLQQLLRFDHNLRAS
jgi:hypothetical protein